MKCRQVCDPCLSLSLPLSSPPPFAYSLRLSLSLSLPLSLSTPVSFSLSLCLSVSLSLCLSVSLSLCLSVSLSLCRGRGLAGKCVGLAPKYIWQSRPGSPRYPSRRLPHACCAQLLCAAGTTTPLAICEPISLSLY